MKKRNLFVAAYLAMGVAVGFTSCSNDDVINEVTPGIEQGTDDTQVLTLSIVSSGDGLTTRAGRPLYSSTANQDIQKVALYFVKKDASDQKDKIYLTKLVDWTQAEDYSEGKQLEIALKKENNQKLPDGTYTVYAVGYSDKSDYTFTPAAPTSDGTVQSDNLVEWSKFQASIEYDLNSNGAEEVFAGSLENLVVEDGAFSLSDLIIGDNAKRVITLHRQVAGVTGYFTNIPVEVDGKNSRYLRLVAVNNSTVALFDDFNTEFQHPTTPQSNVMYVVNGTTAPTAENNVKFADGSTQGYALYQIDLKDWFAQDPRYNDEVTTNGYRGYDYNGDGFLGYGDIKEYLKDNPAKEGEEEDYSAVWAKPNSKSKVSFVRGSVFDGKFVIPFEKSSSDKQTLQLQLLDKDKKVIKYWNINIKQTDLHLTNSGLELDYEKLDKNTSVYNIFRNHMYNVGMKTSDATTDPEDPDKPVDPTDPEEPENPEDLSKGQDLVILVNDNWEVIHQMEID